MSNSAKRLDVQAGEILLDVAAGNGNVSLAAARRFVAVTCTDYVPTLLDRAVLRAEVEGLKIEPKVADVENLPFDDDSFDLVVSTFGAMFAPESPWCGRGDVQGLSSRGAHWHGQLDA